jgi:outer membrane lipoprotein-sorting protein
MRSKCTRILLAVSMLTRAGAVSAQTADDIIEKSLTAQGGRAALGKVTSRSTTGSLAVSTEGGNFSGTIEVLNQAPNKVRTLITLDLSSVGAGSLVVDQRFDGTKAYRLDSMQGDSDVTGSRLEYLRNNVFPTPFLNYKERGVQVTLVGKEKLGDRDAYVLTFAPPTGPASRAWIDAESYLPAKVVVTIDTPETGPLEQTTEFSDFREVDGVKVPFRFKNSSAVQTFTVTITKVEHNVKIDAALFSKPASK